MGNDGNGDRGVCVKLEDRRASSRRLPDEGPVECVAEARLPTEVGEFRILGFRHRASHEEFVVLAKGEFSADRSCLVRIHSQCLTGDVFHSVKCDCGRQLRRAMEMIEDEGVGAIVYQQQEGRGIGIMNKLRAYALQDQGRDTVEANLELGLAVDGRSYEGCAEVLQALGLRRLRVLSNNPAKISALEAAGLIVDARVPLEMPPAGENLDYLRVKKEKMGHLLSGV
ncbi:MAG: GTP cyclohydrolase II [Acidobacteria bacterium]|nr:GTP cyclohydrolase II [Acidobacteriota bacterium]